MQVVKKDQTKPKVNIRLLAIIIGFILSQLCQQIENPTINEICNLGAKVLPVACY